MSNDHESIIQLLESELKELRNKQALTRVGNPIVDLIVNQQPIQIKLSFESRGDYFQVTWQSDFFGPYSPTSTFRSPYNALELPIIIKALDAIQWPQHPLKGPRITVSEQEHLARHGLWSQNNITADIHEHVGRDLYNSLIDDRHGYVALWSVRNFATVSGLPLSYVFCFPSSMPELAALPWELMRDGDDVLLRSDGTLASYVRYLILERTPPSKPPKTSLQVLAIVPKARLSDSRRAAERTARQEAWSDFDPNEVKIEELHEATIECLTDRIFNDPPVDIIHFYGHGRYKDNKGELLFDAPKDRKAEELWVKADNLTVLFSKTRLVMLHACQSAKVGVGGLLTGVAPALSAAGAPAVVAMQLAVRSSAANRFFGVVYRRLARGDSVQEAVSKAREALYADPSYGPSWYVPTLMIRARDTGPMYLMSKKVKA